MTELVPQSSLSLTKINVTDETSGSSSSSRKRLLFWLHISFSHHCGQSLNKWTSNQMTVVVTWQAVASQCRCQLTQIQQVCVATKEKCSPGARITGRARRTRITSNLHLTLISLWLLMNHNMRRTRPLLNIQHGHRTLMMLWLNWKTPKMMRKFFFSQEVTKC